MALTYNKQTRTLSLRGAITRSDGTQISLTTDDILAYTISESSGSEGLPLGSTEAASFSLTISNVGKGYTPNQFDNAEVHMEVGIKNANGTIAYSAFGVWYVCEVSAPEQSVSIDLSGYDALATLFEATYTDTASAYPTTLGSLATAICASAGIQLSTAAFRNADIAVQKKPDWGDEPTLRTIIGYISACAGGFARIARGGKLEIMSYCDGAAYAIDSDLYSTLTRVNGSDFRFNALEVKDAGSDADEETYTRYAIDTTLTDNPTNTIRIEDNPLFTAGVAESVKTILAGLSFSAVSVNWVADPAVRIGDKLTVTDTSGNTLLLLINSQSITFAGGMSATSECNLPALNSANSGSYTSSGNIIDSNGNIRVTRIANFDKSVVSATVGHFEELTAASASIDRLLASIIDAVTLRAQNISASSVETDKLTAALASIMEATIRKITAETITTDTLVANMAKLFSLKVSQITAEDIETDELAAELARITVLICGSASFDKATIKHLVADAMNLEYGVAGQVFIKNLAVEYAQMVGATIGNLCIKASDGKYYLLDVGADGKVTAAETTVTDGEIEAGQTSGGSVIVETNITAANLTTTNLLATYALINKIDAARIDVDELVARRTFTDALYTSKIYGGKSLEIIVGDVSKAQSDIDNMSIGGRNLALKSENEKGPARNVDYIVAANQFTAGEYYAFSAEMKSPNENSVLAYLNDDSGGSNISIGFERAGVKLTADWVRYSFVSKADKNFTYDGEGQGLGKLRMRIYGTTAGATDIMVRKVKLEKGNKATDWTPALEDTDTKIDKAQTAADKAQTSVDDLEVGGRNYIRNGDFSDGENHWEKWGSPTTKEVVEISGKHWAHIVGDANLSFQGIAQNLSFIRNEPLVLSFTAYSSVENTSLQMIIHQRGANNDPQIGNNWLLSTSPKKYYKAFTSADDATKTSFGLMLGPYKNANDVYITDIKFERGNKATDWTAAPEDTDGKIDNAQTAADNAQTAADAAQSTADSANKLALSASTGIQRMNEYVQIKEDGTHMRARDTDNEMVLSSQGVEINVGGQNYSQFGAMYVQFGNYQLRRTADGGLAFKLRVQGGE